MAVVDPIRVEDALTRFPYPGRREQLQDHARRTGAGDDVVAALGAIPSGVYRSSAEVMRAVADDSDPDVP
ncbi:DUF2795 domain-containing protein [Thermostaphylospora chromogena]|uniref:DUF2795 domain-containing protein n=1 Tax=Thermostaphylospora chromogena TaxID=35622 RepID=A0A1H1DTK3_9ACTN|nr:DUF2795 domain-containing protein [Thermostaphylospora chromogena]SDQ79815.1 Protein of unknown function [Thermostaphylospora chromogena]